MKNYIVRIYRRDDEDPNRLVGVVEEVGVEKKRRFHTAEEFACILTGQSYGVKGGETENGRKSGREKFNDDIKKERRKVERLKLNLPVRLKGTDPLGKSFNEETTLKDISPRGAYIFVNTQVSRNARIHLLIDPGRSSLDVKARVVRLDEGFERNGAGVLFDKKL